MADESKRDENIVSIPDILSLRERDEGKEEENIQAFMDGFNELLESKAEEFTFSKIKLPNSLEIEPSILKPLTKLVEVA